MNVFIQKKNLEKYGLLDEGKAVVPYASLRRAPIVEEIEKFGFMCDFHAFKNELKKLQDEDILLVGDPEQTYGDDWRICLTSEAASRERAAIDERKAAEESRAAAAASAAESDEKEEENSSKAVYEDKVFVAKPYEASPSTEFEVAALAEAPDRPLLVYRVSRDRASTGIKCNFGDRDADNEKYIEHRAQKNPDFELQRRQRDSMVQVAPSTTCGATQTARFRLINRPTQYETTLSLMDHVTTTLPSTNKDAEEERLAAFLVSVRPTVEEALQQNESVDVFADLFHGLGDDDTAANDKGENELKELRTFNDIVYSKNMSLNAIDWHPTQKGMLAVSPTRNLNFDEKTALSGKSHNSYILLWDFVDLIHPQLLLESPQDIVCFKFNTEQPHLLVAGAANGQVILWDLQSAMSALMRRQHRTSTDSTNDQDDDSDGDELGIVDEAANAAHQATVVRPHAISHLDQTHRRVVSDLCWLPSNIQITSRGNLVGPNQCNGPSSQFITVSGDGQVMFWDVRYKDIAAGKLPYIGKKAAINGIGGASSDLGNKTSAKDGSKTSIPWYPLFKMQLKRLEGVGDLSLCRICHGLSNEPSTEDRRSQFYCSSEEGEIVFADWRATLSAASSGAQSEDVGDDVDTPEYVQWMAADHNRPAVALEQSPFFPDLILSIGDWSFQLWKLDHRRPIFCSPQASSSLTCGCWSPTRPGMLYMARADGALDVWDLTDSSYRPSAQLMVAPTRITSIKFLTAHSKQQLLAIGDKVGNLHVFDVPRNLSRLLPNEKTLMSNFIDGEVGRVNYVDKKWEERKETTEELLETPAPNSPGGPGHVSTMDASAAPRTEEVEFSPAELATINEAYESQQAKFAEIMGVDLGDNVAAIKSNDVTVAVN